MVMAADVQASSCGRYYTHWQQHGQAAGSQHNNNTFEISHYCVDSEYMLQKHVFMHVPMYKIMLRIAE
jgi:hypothetical protein